MELWGVLQVIWRLNTVLQLCNVHQSTGLDRITCILLCATIFSLSQATTFYQEDVYLEILPWFWWSWISISLTDIESCKDCGPFPSTICIGSASPLQFIHIEETCCAPGEIKEAKKSDKWDDCVIRHRLKPEWREPDEWNGRWSIWPADMRTTRGILTLYQIEHMPKSHAKLKCSNHRSEPLSWLKVQGLKLKNAQRECAKG